MKMLSIAFVLLAVSVLSPVSALSDFKLAQQQIANAGAAAVVDEKGNIVQELEEQEGQEEEDRASMIDEAPGYSLKDPWRAKCPKGGKRIATEAACKQAFLDMQMSKKGLKWGGAANPRRGCSTWNDIDTSEHKCVVQHHTDGQKEVKFNTYQGTGRLCSNQIMAELGARVVDDAVAHKQEDEEICKSTKACKNTRRRRGRKYIKSCSFYKKYGYCKYAKTGANRRRRRFGIDARRNCKKKCGICKACKDGKGTHKTCDWYKTKGRSYCEMGKSATVRRRSWGGDAKDNCEKSCGYC